MRYDRWRTNGAHSKAEPREAVVERMLALMESKWCRCDPVVYPELCLTTFFHVGISKTS